MRGHSALRALVGCAVEYVDRVCETPLCRGHGCARAVSSGQGAAHTSGRTRTAHGIQVALRLLLHLLAFFLEPIPGSASYDRQELSGEQDVRLVLGFFVSEVTVNRPFDLTGLLQELCMECVSCQPEHLAATSGSDDALAR